MGFDVNVKRRLRRDNAHARYTNVMTGRATMLPKIKQYRKWTLPSKYSFWGVWLSVALGISSYVAPIDKLIHEMGRYRVEVPGNSEVERRINQAKMEGVAYKTPQSQNFLAKFINRPMLNYANEPEKLGEYDLYAALSSVTPVKPVDQELIFDPGKCRFSGSATEYNVKDKTAKFAIEGLSCVDSNFNYYGIESRNIGYIMSASNSATKKIPVIIDSDGYIGINPEENVRVMLYEPIRELEYKGKSLLAF